jgi:hypothetical protein
MRSGCVMRTVPAALGTAFARFAAGTDFFVAPARFRAGIAGFGFAIEKSPCA